MRTAWCDNSPDSLLDIAASFCITNLDVFKRHIKAAADNDIGIHLPLEIGEKLFQVEHRHVAYFIIGIYFWKRWLSNLTGISMTSLLTSSGTWRGWGWSKYIQAIKCHYWNFRSTEYSSESAPSQIEALNICWGTSRGSSTFILANISRWA